MPELNAGAEQTEEQKTAMAALMKPMAAGQAAAAQGALATKSSRDDAAKSAGAPDPRDELAVKAERAAKAERDAARASYKYDSTDRMGGFDKRANTIDEIVAVWFAETRLHQPPMVNQHPMDWVQSQLPKLVAALSRRP